MIRYKIRIDCRGGLFYLPKEYTSISNVLKALYMINFEKFGEVEIKVTKLVNDIEVSLSDQIIL
jgi:hypothetical protein